MSLFSGLEKAYTSVLSIAGSAAVNGASRWLDAPAVAVNNPMSEEAASAPPAATSAVARTVRPPRLSMVRDMHASSCPVR